MVFLCVLHRLSFRWKFSKYYFSKYLYGRKILHCIKNELLFLVYLCNSAILMYKDLLISNQALKYRYLFCLPKNSYLCIIFCTFICSCVKFVHILQSNTLFIQIRVCNILKYISVFLEKHISDCIT